MIKKNIPLPWIVAALLGGNSFASDGLPQDWQQLSYQCDGNIFLHVSLSAQQARITLNDRKFTLPRRSDMKGERYLSDDRQTLFLRRGRNAVLAVSAGHGVLRCTETDPADQNKHP